MTMWYCLNCAEEFEQPSVAGEGNGSHWYVCPCCGSDDINEL